MSTMENPQAKKDDVTFIEAWELSGTTFTEPIKWTFMLSGNTASIMKGRESAPLNFSKEDSKKLVLFSSNASSVVGHVKWKKLDGYPTIYFVEGIGRMRRLAISPEDYRRLRLWVPPLPIPTTETFESNIKAELLSRGIGFIALGALHFVFPQYLESTWGIVLIVLGVLNLIDIIILAPGIFILNGLALIIVGILNITSVCNATGSSWSPWLLLGVLQIGWGFSEFKKLGGGEVDKYKGD